MLSLNQIEELAKEYDAYKVILGTNGRATKVIFSIPKGEYYSVVADDFKKEIEGYDCWSWSYGKGGKGFEVVTIRTNI